MKYMDHLLQVRPNRVEVSLVGWFMFLIHLAIVSYNTSFIDSFAILYYNTNYLVWLLLMMGTIWCIYVWAFELYLCFYTCWSFRSALTSIFAICYSVESLLIIFVVINIIVNIIIFQAMYEVHGSFSTGSAQLGWG